MVPSDPPHSVFDPANGGNPEPHIHRHGSHAGHDHGVHHPHPAPKQGSLLHKGAWDRVGLALGLLGLLWLLVAISLAGVGTL